jgi:hypothetical protein
MDHRVARGAAVVGSISAGAADIGQRLSVQPGTFFGEAAEDDAGDRWRHCQRIRRRADRDCRRAIGRKTVDAGGDRRERDRGEAVGLAKFDGAAIARRQRGIFALTAAMPNRPNGMNHMPRRQPITFGDLGLASLAAMERTAFGKKLRPGGTMDGAIDAASAEQRGIGSVDDGVNAKCRDIGDGDFQPRRAKLARGKAQAVAAALTVTPLSARSCCSSPAWNISRMMSQPPTNSPLT